MDSKKWIGFQILTKLKKRVAKRYANSVEESSLSDETSTILDSGAMESVEYDFITIQNATNNFSEANKIGGGGFGAVYKATLKGGEQVAVKRLSQNLRENPEFKNEVALIAKLQHRNLVKLLGFSLEGNEMLLVYEFVPNGGLDNILFDPVKCVCLDWERRYNIIKCITRGLIYLHEGSRLCIIHCNLKASNVLLDEDLNPKIADFDMARLFVLDKTHGSTSRIVGTDGYMAPEYALQGEISVKSDVYSFGVLVLEIISGRSASSFQNEERIKDLPSHAWTHWKGESASNVIDPMLSPVHEITKCINIALLCVQENVADRPKMVEVLQMLSNLSMSLPVPLAPRFFIHGSISSKASILITKNVKSLSDQYHRKLQKRKAQSYGKTVEEASSSAENSSLESHLKYEFSTIQNATDNFSEANLLGKGGFGNVYKGKLKNGQLVAVKRLSQSSSQGNREFINEVVLIARLQHRNLVRLLGYCMEGRDVILVYEYVPNGGLDSILFDPVKHGYLDWGRRYRIIESIAKGLVYLHEDSRLRILHRDVKASNILLDADLNPKLADFGIACLPNLHETHVKDMIVGTFGYIAPEYLLRGRFSIKSDVYSFGALVLEIISGQRYVSIQNGKLVYFTGYAWTHWKNESSSNLIHPMLRGISSPVEDIIKCIHIALLCVQENDEDRPTMGEVLQMLSNLSMSLPLPSSPPYVNSSTGSDASISDGN